MDADMYTRRTTAPVYRCYAAVFCSHLRGLADARLQQDVQQRAHGKVRLLAAALRLATHQARATRIAQSPAC